MADVKEVAKEIKKEETAIKKFFRKRENVWMVVSGVLVILLLISIAWPKGGAGLSEEKAAEKLVDFLNGNVVQGGGVTLKAVEDSGSLYKVTVIYQSQEIPVYVTKDGKYFIQGATPIDEIEDSGDAGDDTQTPTEVPKTDKPKVEAFVFSYCPYGLQFEKALSPVYGLLKNKADINLVAIGAMHGIHEETESLRQICIQKNYGKDKLWAYLDKFMADTKIGDCNSNMNCSKPLVEAIMKSLSIDVAKINTCLTTDGKALYEADNARAASLGQSGSPGFMINGVDVQVGRNPEAIKQAICNAFTTAPAECSTTLSTTSASAWFGSDAGTGNSGQC